MADEPNPFAALMERVAQGNQQAATELFQQYHKALIRVIRYRLNRSPQLRALFDSIDFLQEVWQDVFAHPEKLSEFATFKAFLNYLAQMACHKVEKARRKHDALKRDQGRVRHLGVSGVATTAAAVADPRPSPAQEAVSQDAWERWILSLSQRQQQIILMLRDGLTYPEIAAELGCCVRSIERMVSEIRDMPPSCS